MKMPMTRNREKWVLRRCACIALGLAVLLGGTLPCLAAENEALPVRVGFFAFAGYHEQDESGARDGYGYELLQHLAGYGNFRYVYVGYDKSWSEMQQMLEAGEIDLLTSAQKTPEREERFDFSSENIGVSTAILTVKSGDGRYMQADYANWNGIRVGMLYGNSRNDSFAAYAGEQGFSYEPVYYDSTEAMLAELKSGAANKRIDAVLTSNLRQIEGEWVLAQFDSSPFYIMVRKGNRALLDRIDSALKQMYACEPNLRTQLMSRYYTPTSDDEIAFTPEERAYMQRMRGTELTAVINPDRAPYSWVEDGTLRGILYDAAQKAVARCGLNVTFLDVRDRGQYLAAVAAGDADIRFDAGYSYNQAERDGCWLTVPYVTVPLARVYRKTTTAFHTVSMPLNQDITSVPETGGEGGSPACYESVSETVQAVLEGRQDAAILALDTATMAVRDDVTNKLVAEELFGEEISFAAAVNQDQDPLLYAILNKAVSSLSDREIDVIRQSYAANMEKPFSLVGYFYDYPLHVLIGVASLLGGVALIGLLISMARQRKAERQRLQKEQAQNELLKDALSAAERAGAAKSQFLSRVSHEMRTPLNAIIGFIELAKGADKAQMEDYRASSDLAARQLLNVINAVLDMSSIESGKLKIANAPFNFRRLISSITNIYGTQCRQKGLDFETRITTPTEDWLVGDELRVYQILMNLLGNAVKFTSKGFIRLTITETAAAGNKLFLRFEVSDTGCGMSEEMQERLFRPFEQESAATAKKYGGSGLGLSIVKNLAGMMGGTVRVESAQGKGTRFTVDLPFQRSDVESIAALPQKASLLRILAVDDQQTERDYISAVLTRMGVRYACVGSGGEALDAMEKAAGEGAPYNVCLIDWRMPEMDGIDTATRIREAYGKDMIVIVVSAYDFQQAKERAKAAGANLFLSKPIFQSSLFDLLMTLTDGSAAEPKNVEQPKNWDFAGRRVLLAEDNALNQIVATGYLTRYNLAVDLAENGQIAVGKFTASPPGYYDAILMDIQMPGMDGLAATRAIRESGHPEAKTVQIIAQTADAFNEDIARALSAGMNAHLSKPLQPELLAKALYQAFSSGGKTR